MESVLSEDSRQGPIPSARWRTALAWGWCLVILVLCWFPRTRMPVVETGPGTIPNLDKVVHFAIFAVFGGLWRLAGLTPIRIVAAGSVLAIVSEMGQAVPAVGRDPGLWDAVADIAGVAIVAFVNRGGARAPVEMPPRP